MEPFAYELSETLRGVALGLPETSEGTSCVNRAFKVRKKNFLFIGEKDGAIKVMLKLTESIGDAEGMDQRVSVGTAGWVTIRFAPDHSLDAATLSQWVVESFRACAPKTVVRQLSEQG